MSINSVARGVFVPACLTFFAALLPAVTPQTSLNGNYVLAEEGTAAGGNFASLAMLNFKDGGAVTGKEFVRTSTGTQWVDLTGTYAFEGTNLGNLTLSSTTQDADGNDVITTMNYKFAVSASQIQAMRTDLADLSSAYLVPVGVALNGSFAFSQVDPADSSARVVSFSIDNLGNMTGTSIARKFGNLASSNVSGNYTQGDNGFGTLTFTSQLVDDDGNLSTIAEPYVVLSAKDRAIAVRTDGGTIGLTLLSK